MKLWKNTLFTAAAFLTVAGSVLYSSCEKDPCTQLACKNNSACSEGFCRCATGFEGAECEYKTINRFLGTYIGYTRCGEDPNLVDTLEVFQIAEPDKVQFFRHGTPNSNVNGTVNGYRVVVPDDIQGNTAHYVNAVVEGNKISVFDERVSDVTTGAKSVCSFVGFRQ